MTETPLKLVALEPDDVPILSVHLQDAVLKRGDVAFLARERRFVMVCNRFDWEAAVINGARQRRRTGVRIDQVRSVKARAMPPEPGATLALLAVIFTPGEAPGGVIDLAFSGGAALRIEVDCVEMAMDDLGPMWATDVTPTHET